MRGQFRAPKHIISCQSRQKKLNCATKSLAYLNCSLNNKKNVKICCRFTDQTVTKVQLELANIMNTLQKHKKLVAEAATVGKVMITVVEYNMQFTVNPMQNVQSKIDKNKDLL